MALQVSLWGFHKYGKSVFAEGVRALVAKALDMFHIFWMGSLRILPLNIVTVVFDELGLTDNKNPFGLISFLHPFLDLLSAGK